MERKEVAGYELNNSKFKVQNSRFKILILTAEALGTVLKKSNGELVNGRLINPEILLHGIPFIKPYSKTVAQPKPLL